MITVILSAGAASAAFGIFQYAILHYDIHQPGPRHARSLHDVFRAGDAGHLRRARADSVRPPRSALGGARHAGAGRRRRRDLHAKRRVGACVAAALLLSLKDFRLLAVLPIVAALFFALAGPDLTSRFASIFDVNNPTNRDRVAMLKEGGRMIRAHPLFGVGPNMVEARYAEYRGPDAVEPVNPHLHNVPVQIAAERGLPALAVWLWFVAVLRDRSRSRVPPAPATGCSPPPRSPRWSRRWRPDCSSTTSAIPSS